MCRSVPQIAVFSSLIRTSLAPGVGTGTCSIQMPFSAWRLTRAFIVAAIACPSCNRAGRELYQPAATLPADTGDARRGGSGSDRLGLGAQVVEHRRERTLDHQE